MQTDSACVCKTRIRRLSSPVRGGPGQGTVLLSYLVYINAFERLSLGRASAMAVLLALLIMSLIALTLFALHEGR